MYAVMECYDDPRSRKTDSIDWGAELEGDYRFLFGIVPNDHL